MENIDIQTLWKQNETLLEDNRRLNLKLLKEVKLDKTKSALQSLLFLPISTLVFFALVATYAMYFAVAHFNVWYFAFSGGVVSFFSIWYVVTAIKQLKQILSVNYNNPITTLQKDIAKIKVLVIKNLRIAAWLLPFGPFVGVFVVQVVFGWDLMALMNFEMLVSFGFSTVILEIISLMALRALRSKNINKTWLNGLLQGSGSQVDEALTFLDQIKTFETE